MIPHSRPDLGREEAEAAQDVVASGDVAQGPVVAAFEAEMAAFLGRGHGIATSSGTAALQLVLQALGVQDGRVLIPSYVCAALVHATRAAGAEPVLSDVDGSTGNMAVVPPQTEGCAAAIVPHMFGRPSPVVRGLSAQLPVIEDLAMALGSTGTGGHGIAAVCSFYATKVITSGGEGGMVLTDDGELAQRVRELREYDGMALERARWNYKLTDVGAAVGRVQLRRLPQLLQRRRALAARYDESLSGCGADAPAPQVGSNHYRYVMAVAPDALEGSLAAFEAQGVAARRPVPQALHESMSDPGHFPGTMQMLKRALSLPLYPALSDADARHVAQVAARVLS
ncbi:MAG: DegT/DnrJ/EryC1/StrS family aminotransferase [Candidatus Latescibacteria bacterium]|jgi:dTDP-4-amino-4,6-dideoxygalactose transaminase|nr:DegT/DnrJ/EryC1/StrS family aminotransferase [Candidatus Latescibacterota bacterium]